MEAEEITKLVDGVYKNILEKFNPGARQLITAGKAYLKALHGAASASRLFNEALAKIAMNAQQSGTGDIGSALMNVVSVYKEIQDQQMNILKAFYVDLLVPLETNLEKDTKVVQHEQKKFLQQHKIRMESYHKAVSTMKKQRKKKNTPENTEKEIKSLQLLDDQRKKLDNFCEQSYKNAMTQERRRYGFVLERQCSIAKHWMAYYEHGKGAIENSLENWQEVAASREVIPTVYENNFLKRMEKIKEDENHGGSSMLKKARSVDAPYGDMRTLNENNYSQNSLPRAKSDFNLTTSASSNENWDQRPVVKALYAYMPSGENQLPFAEGDRIALVGNKAKGWQFGENVRTQMFGWFPIAYTNAESNEKKADRDRESNYENVQFDRNGMRSYQEYLSNHADVAVESDSTYRRRNTSAEESSPTRMFGDTIMFRNQKKSRGVSGGNPRPGPPPTLPAPVPSASNSSRVLNVSQSFCLPNGPPIIERRKHKNQNGPPPTQPMMHSNQKHLREGTAKTSLHSSNDSGFANEPPPQPEVDYSDEEHSSRVPIRRRTDASYQSSREVNSWTLSRNFKSSPSSSQKHSTIVRKPMKQSASFENIIASDDEILHGGGIKRTKSFWRFGKSDEILAGMSLWRHRDLVQLPDPQVDVDNTLTATANNKSKSSDVVPEKRSSRHSTSSNESRPRKESSSTVENIEDENIYGIAPLHEETVQRKYHQQKQPPSHNNYQDKHAPKSRMKIMKTIEIDIENRSDAERMNSLKHSQNKEYSENSQHTASRSNHQQQRLQTAPNASTNAKATKKVNNKTGNSKQQMTAQKISKSKKIINKHDQSSSDSEADDNDEDDDNDTLKMSDVNNFFDDISAQECGVVMKTVKRQDILKQYYTSEDEESDIEVKSTSSDPYDCIVINDHLVRKDEKNRRQVNSYHEQMEFQTFRSVPKKSTGNINNNKAQQGTLNNNNNNSNNSNDDHQRVEEPYVVDSKTMGQTATILPRTRLMKSSNLSLEKNLKKNKDNNANLNAEKAKSFAKTYGPWYDFWDQQDQSEDHSVQNSKLMK